MTSLLTNTVGLSALRVLTAIQKALTATEVQASTGLRIGEASDNAAYWTVGIAMKSQIGALEAVNSGLGLLQGVADVTASALDGAIGIVRSMQQDLTAVSQAGTDATALQKSIAGKQAELLNVVKAASFNGVNWLTQSDHYKVSETLTIIATNAVSQTQYHAMHAGDSWNSTEALTDSFSLTDPAGNVSTYQYAQSTENWVTTVSGGLVTSGLSRSAPAITQQDNSVSNNGTAVPFSAGQAGTLYGSINVARFTLLADVDVAVTRNDVTTFTDGPVNNNFSGAGSLSAVGTQAIWGDEVNPGQAFLNSLLPPSPLTGLLKIDVTDATAATQNRQTVAGALNTLMTIASSVGSLKGQIDSQIAFNSALSDALTSGVGSIVDADMNVVSTRLQALQTQQQLGTQALSIANQNSRVILTLFQ
jgi:flagellin